MSVAPSRLTGRGPATMSIAGSVLTAPTIKCCLCGLDIVGMHSMCINCLAKETDCTATLSKKEQLTQCRECGKWKGATQRWLRLDPESPELLALCLKKVKNLGSAKGARLIDAKFVWTEEHSRRIVVRMEVESMEVTSRRDAIRQQCECEFVVVTQMCPDCQSDTVDQTWRAVVQIRQNLNHRRTLFFLEQEILHRKLAEKATNVEESPHGLDVFFNKHDHAAKFADACQAIVPIGVRTESKKLTGQDVRNNEFKFRHTICLEIVPLCKHDLCILSKPLRSSLLGGSRNGLIIVESVARNIHLRDVETGRTAELQAAKYAAHPFRAITSAKDMTEFMVFDLEDVDEDCKTLEVARMRDVGETDDRFFIDTWSKFAMSNLQAGDVVLGYDLTSLPEDELVDRDSIPQAVLLKKKQPEKETSTKTKKSKKKSQKAEPSHLAESDEDEIVESVEPGDAPNDQE